MKKDLDDQLCKEFPKLFVNRNASETETNMCWGFACGDGWYNIIHALCSNIQSHIDWRVKQGREITQVTVQQVKEKFGTLRFYYDGGDDYISGLVTMAETMSGHTCDVCGSPGKRTGGGWIRTLCSKHAEEMENERAERMRADGLEE
jgi:hypothetical protein